jgi:hypothetical protein
MDKKSFLLKKYYSSQSNNTRQSTNIDNNFKLSNSEKKFYNIQKLNNWQKALYIYQYISKNNIDFINILKENTSYDNIITHNNSNHIINNDLLLISNDSTITEDLQNLLNDNKLITIRMGCVESAFILKYIYNFTIYNDHLITNIDNVDHYMKANAGLYYTNKYSKKDVFDWYCKNTIEILKKSTITSCLLALHYDLSLLSTLDIKTNIYSWASIHKLILRNLKNKKLLYIGSAVDSIKYAYTKNIQNAWKFNIGTFEMYFVKTPQTTLGMPYPNESIIETTNLIINEIIENYIDFDIAILGCGAYGPPIINILNNKLCNKNMIYLGSMCYTMFGLYSNGIPIPLFDKDVIKEGFIEVLEKCDDKCKNIDQGKYWKK